MKLSIIVPVFNMAADGKLNFCLDSLVKQTISDYEIIAVDDCSTDNSLDILKEYGNELREPYTKYLEDGIFELRIKLGSDISRILYFFYDGRNIVLTNGFIKKTWKTPRGEIEKAKMYRKDYFHRTERL